VIHFLRSILPGSKRESDFFVGILGVITKKLFLAQ
jgi:hypothetical protein